MLTLWLTGLLRYLRLLWQAAASFFEPGRRLRGSLWLVLLTPLIVLLQTVNWVFWLSDEIFFRGYRRIEVRQPLFVIGPPRTGTTFLHHVLAEDPRRTTFTLWECLFGFTISGHKLCRGLVSLDRLVGRPAGRLIDLANRRALASMDDVHPLRLDAPEEDFLLFLPFAACFLLLVPFPRAEWLWNVAALDEALPEKERRRIMRWYRRCIQKHLYVRGRDLGFLSKNASFAGTVESLLEEFPDARILSTWRDPLEAVPSQLSSLRPALELFGYDRVGDTFRDRLIDNMAFYYRHLERAESRHPERIQRIDNRALRGDLKGSVAAAFETLGLALDPVFSERLDGLAEQSRSHESSHEYSLEEFGLDAELLRSRFDAPT